MLFSLGFQIALSFMKQPKTSLHEYFERFPVHRLNRNKKHLLSDIIILSILGVLCGAESWDSIETFGKTKLDFLSRFLKLPHGTPHTTQSIGFLVVSFQAVRKDVCSLGRWTEG